MRCLDLLKNSVGGSGDYQRHEAGCELIIDEEDRLHRLVAAIHLLLHV